MFPAYGMFTLLPDNSTPHRQLLMGEVRGRVGGACT